MQALILLMSFVVSVLFIAVIGIKIQKLLKLYLPIVYACIVLTLILISALLGRHDVVRYSELGVMVIFLVYVQLMEGIMKSLRELADYLDHLN